MRRSRLTLFGVSLLVFALAAAGCGGGKGSVTGPSDTPAVFQRVRITADPQTIGAGGSSTITVTATDANGGPVAGVNVILTTTAGTLTPTSGQTGDDGAFRATLRTDRTATVTASIPNTPIRIATVVGVR